MKGQGGFTLVEVIVSLALSVLLWGSALTALTVAARVTARMQQQRRMEQLAGSLLDQIENELSGCRPAGDGSLAESVVFAQAGDAVSFQNAGGVQTAFSLQDGRLCCRKDGAEAGLPGEVYQDVQLTALCFSPAESQAGRPALVRASLELTAPDGGVCQAERLIACPDLDRGLTLP